MNRDDLLHSLKDLLAECCSANQKKRVQDLSKGRVTDDLLYSCDQTLDDEQLEQVKIVVGHLLQNHLDFPEIIKKLELTHLFDHNKAASLHKFKAHNREQLLQSVNFLVSSGDLVAAEELLEEALAENEAPELLDLLGRVCMLQSRPKQAAALMQRALQSRRQQIAFIEQPQILEHVSVIDDDAVTTADLEYITSDASVFVGLDASSCWLDEVTESTNTQLEASPLAGHSHSLELSLDNKTVICPASLPGAEDTQHTSGEKRKILSLARASKPVDVTLTPTDASHSSTEPRQPLTFEDARLDKARLSGSESEYCDIQELPGGIELLNLNEFHTFLGEDQVEQSDCYELEGDLFDNGEILVEQELNFCVTDEFDIYDRNNDDEYAAYDFDPDDAYDIPDNLDFDAVLFDGRVSREDRALQKAVELISRAGWSLSMLPLVQQIFVMSGWGATRLALERELDKGMTPDELILAAHVKALWAENDYYWIAYDKSGSSNLSQYIISWPTALQLVRVFESLPQVEELEQFIETLFEYWYDHSSLHRAFQSFSRFLWFRVFNLQGSLPANLPFYICSPYELPVEEFSDLGIGDPLGIEHTAQLRAFGVIQSKHPQEPGCYASDKPVPVDEYSMATQTSKEKSNDA